MQFICNYDDKISLILTVKEDVTFTLNDSEITVSVKKVAQKAIDTQKETVEKSLADSTWHQRKFIKTNPISGSIHWLDTLITMHNDGLVQWWELPNLSLNGAALQTDYMLGNPVLINNTLYCVGPTSTNNWNIVQIDPSYRTLGLVYTGSAVMGIATDGTNLWALTDSNTLLNLNPTDFNLLQTFDLSLQNAEIVMYMPGKLVVGDVSGQVVVVDSASGEQLAGIVTDYNAASLSVVADDQIAISSQWDQAASVVMYNPTTQQEIESSLDSIPYNGVNDMVQVGSDFFIATSKGVGLCTQNHATQQLVLQSMLVDGKDNGYLNVWDLPVKNNKQVIATGNCGIYEIVNSPAKPGLSKMHGTLVPQIVPSPFEKRRREALLATKV